MIGLFGRDEQSLLGLATILDIERIPYVKLSRLDACGSRLPVAVGAELSRAESESLTARAGVVLHGGIQFATHAGAAAASTRTGPCAINLQAPIWPCQVRQEAARAGQSALRIPCAPRLDVELPGADRLALLEFGDRHDPRPAVVQVGPCVWSTVDLGAAFATLLDERYHVTARAAARPSWWNRLTSGAYYAAPEALRRRVRASMYAGLERRLQDASTPHSTYPVDATGWLLIELVKALICRARGWLVRLAHWPAPFAAAAVVTHDIEPRRYAYGTGLPRLLAHAERKQRRAAFGLVAHASARYLTGDDIEHLRDHDIICHGLDHRSETVADRFETATELRLARIQLERQLRRRVVGYRSPRLDRSPHLAWALDRTGFRCDSSFPDVDRENMNHFGGGVCLTLPYRPLVTDGDSLRPSRCLELR